MKEFRMKSLEIFNNSTMPDEWGPSIEGLDMDNIVTYVRPNTHMACLLYTSPRNTRVSGNKPAKRRINPEKQCKIRKNKKKNKKGRHFCACLFFNNVV